MVAGSGWLGWNEWPSGHSCSHFVTILVLAVVFVGFTCPKATEFSDLGLMLKDQNVWTLFVPIFKLTNVDKRSANASPKFMRPGPV